MAEAVQALWPGTQVTIGPVIENGFFYDFAKDEPFHPDDIAKIEAKMREIIDRNAPFTKEFWSREQAKDFFRKKGELFKIELVDAIPEGEDLKIYKQGDWLDLCRGPHMTSTGQIGKAFKLTRFAGSYWRGDAQRPQAAAHLRHRLGDRRRSSPLTSSSSRRPRSATTASSAARWTCSISRRRGRASVFWHPKGWELFQTSDHLHAPPPGRGRLPRGERAADARQVTLGDCRATGRTIREHMFVTETDGRARVRAASR